MSDTARLPNASIVRDDQVKWLMDRIEIQDVIARYSLGQDSHQGEDARILEQWDKTFTDDGMVDYSVAGGPVGTYRELARWMRGDGTTPGSMGAFSNWQHMLSLPNVLIDGDRASARTDFYATHRSKAGQAVVTHFNAAGAFVDDLVRTAGGWRIRFRRLELYFADPLQVVSATV
ncbi:SnoaL-like protein [Paraburkholderia silvatlantica]|uniref:SnoaL-like protein n=1 Tax=Paraburkholderia silvatlantica TaxID=321895 RepID=A0A2V4UQW2_9BURK|nr:nuclear transport factor 2 family protein [Paraburkholderia silvatlantica]PYE23136.1 SnoaL-like protein [Paraburkholderia silvatlantica]